MKKNFHRMMFWAVMMFCRIFYRYSVLGKENMEMPGERPALYICNHLSYLDAMFVACVVPVGTPFVVYGPVARGMTCRLLKFLGLNLIPVETDSPYSVKTMVKALTDEAGPRSLVIFPEGRLTTTGGMMSIQPGAGLVAMKSGAVIVPMHLDGAEHLHLNRLAGKFRKMARPRISMTIGQSRVIPDYEGETPRRQRTLASDFIEKMLAETGIGDNRNLLTAFIDAASRHGWKREILDDVRSSHMSYRKLFLTAIVAGDFATRNMSGDDKTVGVMLPNAGVTIATMMGVFFHGKTFLPLNFTSGPDVLTSVCQTACVKRVITSHGFIEKAGLAKVEKAMRESGIELLYAEDIANLGFLTKMKALFFSRFPRLLTGYTTAPDSPMVILSTSGSEGMPKGVCLSSRNMLTNIQQVLRTIDVTSADRFLNAMPVFHSFGLMGGVLLPILQGAWSFQYPSPLHGRFITSISYGHNITIAFATNTFLNIWARHAKARSFYAMRAIVAGAEKITPQTREMYAERFGVKILEGYGATETSPVLALNTFEHNRSGTVGRLLPGMRMALEDVPGVDGKRLHVSGPNVMLGYLKSDAPGILVESHGQYDTGDIVTVDGDNYIRIEGRAKRFAKIAGEMVSLGAVEVMAENALSQEIAAMKDAVGPAKASLQGLAVIAVPDEKKGERLVVCLTGPENTIDGVKEKVQEYMNRNGASELMVPKDFRHIEALPLLGTGKINYPLLQKTL